jgi:hypothetical protein
MASPSQTRAVDRHCWRALAKYVIRAPMVICHHEQQLNGLSFCFTRDSGLTINLDRRGAQSRHTVDAAGPRRTFILEACPREFRACGSPAFWQTGRRPWLFP